MLSWWREWLQCVLIQLVDGIINALPTQASKRRPMISYKELVHRITLN